MNAARVASRFAAISALAMVIVGVASNFLVAPALAATSIGESYSKIPLESVISTILWTAGWALSTFLVFFASRSLLESLCSKRVAGDGRGALIGAVVVGMLAAAAWTFLFPYSTASLAFARIAGDEFVNPLSEFLIGLGLPFAIVAALLSALGAAMLRGETLRQRTAG